MLTCGDDIRKSKSFYEALFRLISEKRNISSTKYYDIYYAARSKVTNRALELALASIEEQFGQPILRYKK